MDFVDTLDIDVIDRIEIIKTEENNIDITLETNDDVSDKDIEDFISDEKNISLETLGVLVLMSSFKPTMMNFLVGIYELLEANDRWVEVFNKLFNDIATHDKKKFKLQVVKN